MTFVRVSQGFRGEIFWRIILCPVFSHYVYKICALKLAILEMNKIILLFINAICILTPVSYRKNN